MCPVKRNVFVERLQVYKAFPVLPNTDHDLLGMEFLLDSGIWGSLGATHCLFGFMLEWT